MKNRRKLVFSLYLRGFFSFVQINNFTLYIKLLFLYNGNKRRRRFSKKKKGR